MDFISNGPAQIEKMMQTLGISSVDTLFEDVPPELSLDPIHLDDGISEWEGLRMMEELSNKNSFPSQLNFLGAGAYEHQVPALVSAICQRSEFLTAYTPYQAEMSQGLLQAIFEYQSAVAALTGLEVSNASVYDGATAAAEAVLMALRRRKKRRRVVISEGLHPSYLAVIRHYLSKTDVEVELLPVDANGVTQLACPLDESVACLCLQSPNFFGVMENSQAFFSEAKDKGAIGILVANPVVYGLFKDGGELGADIACGDLQPLGLSLSFGGPYVGYMACRKELVRTLPGRIVGKTEDAAGSEGFVLTLQAREQHIRREKATSNICSNQTLAAIACLVTILWYGPNGLRELAQTNYQRAEYLRRHLRAIPKISVPSTLNFNEFIFETKEISAKDLLRYLERENIQGGVLVERFFPERKNQILVAVTECKSREILDRYVRTVEETC